MRITEIKAKNMDMTDAIKNYATEKLEVVAKLTAKFDPCDVRVELGRDAMHQNKGEVFMAELHMTIPGAAMRAEATKEDLYAAIDAAVAELRRQVKDYKEKLQDADRVVMETEIEETEWTE